MPNVLLANIPETIYIKAQQLSLDKAQEVLDFIEFVEYKTKSQAIAQQKAEATAIIS